MSQQNRTAEQARIARKMAIRKEAKARAAGTATGTKQRRARNDRPEMTTALLAACIEAAGFEKNDYA
jgi:hypothetical protein